jgi:hypothetical protein
MEGPHDDPKGRLGMFATDGDLDVQLAVPRSWPEHPHVAAGIVVVDERSISEVLSVQPQQALDDLLAPDAQRIQLPPVPAAVHDGDEVLPRGGPDRRQRALQGRWKRQWIAAAYTSIAG